MVMTGDMSVVDEEPPVPPPIIEFKPWENTCTWPQALQADRREKAVWQAFDLEFGWMKEADQCLLGHGPHPVTWERFVAKSEANGELFFKAFEQRKPPEDQGKSPDEMYMGTAIVVWNRTQVTALRHVGWASQPMEVSGSLLNMLFDQLPMNSHVYLVLETYEVREAVKACADLITKGLDKDIYCKVESWRRLTDTWKTRGSAMVVREFEEDGDDSDCAGFRAAAIREAWQAEIDAVNEWTNPTTFGGA
jgi:hypothetical protein